MREIAPYGLRMPTELKDRLMRTAKSNGRSLNSELIARLWASLKDEPTALGTAEPRAPAYRADISETEQWLIDLYSRLPVEKQLALIALLK